MLRHLAPSVTEATLKAAVGGIKDLDCRKVEIEPGCAFHFTNEAEATYASKILATALPRCTSNFANATMPSLLLQNLPPTMSAQRLEKTFAKFNPKLVRLTGSATVQVIEVQLVCLAPYLAPYLAPVLRIRHPAGAHLVPYLAPI